MSDFSNPYAPPTTELTAEEAGPASDDLVDASQGQRLANLFLDYIGLFLVMMVVSVPLVMAGVNTEVLGNLIGIVTMLAYYLFFEGVMGRTPGKWITGTRVVRENGSKPRFTQILGRTFARFVPFEPFSFLGSSGGWHDRWSGTRVVRVRR